MNLPRTLGLAVLLGGLAGTAFAQSTARIVSAATAFLGTLDEKQRQAAVFSYDDAAQRTRWSNLPVRMVPRAGLSMGSLSPEQRTAAMAVLAAAFSAEGLEKIQQIVQGDEVLKANEKGNPMFGQDLFFISFLGTPSAKEPWMLQFGGHHLGVNVTIVGEQGVLTPTLTAAQPALYTLNGKTVRPLGDESDKAVTLLKSLDEAQRKQAVLGFRVADLVLGPGKDGKTIQPEGLKASQMTEAQRALLLDLMGEWARIVHPAAAAARMAELKADLAETWFAWSGSTDATVGRNITAYYRIQGPKVVIEYSPQPLGGDPTLHVHTMYRDPTNDYGQKLTKR